MTSERFALSDLSESDDYLRALLDQHSESMEYFVGRCAVCMTRQPCDIASLAGSGLYRSEQADALRAELAEMTAERDMYKGAMEDAITINVKLSTMPTAAELAATQAAYAEMRAVVQQTIEAGDAWDAVDDTEAAGEWRLYTMPDLMRAARAALATDPATRGAAILAAANEVADTATALLVHFERHTDHRCEIDRDAASALDAWGALNVGGREPSS